MLHHQKGSKSILSLTSDRPIHAHSANSANCIQEPVLTGRRTRLVSFKVMTWPAVQTAEGTHVR